MDELKTEIQDKLRKLKDQRTTMVDQLNKLIQLSTHHVNDISKLNSKETRLYSNYLSLVSQFQHLSYLKLTEMNIDLEEFLIDNNPPNLQRLQAPSGVSGNRSFSSRRGSDGSLFSPTTYSPFMATEQVVRLDETVSTLRLDETASTTTEEISSNSEGLLFELDASMEDKCASSESLPVAVPFEPPTIVESQSNSDEISVPFQPVAVVQSESITHRTNLEQIVGIEGITEMEGFERTTTDTDLHSCTSQDENDTLINSVKESTEINTDVTISSHFNQSPTCVHVEEFDESETNKQISNYPASSTSNERIFSSVTVQRKPILMVESSTSLPIDKTKKVKEYHSSSTLISETSSTSDIFEAAASCLDTSSITGSEYFDLSNSSCDELKQVKSECDKATSHSTAMEPKNLDVAKELQAYSRKVHKRHAARFKDLPMPDISLRTVGITSTSSSSNSGDCTNIQVPSRVLVHQDVPVTNAVSVKSEKKKKKKRATAASVKQIGAIPDHDPPKVGDTCMIGYVQSPAEFYIQVCDENCTHIDALSHQLEDFHQNTYITYSSKADAKYKLGNFCCYSLNEYWYRVEVIDWMLNEGANEGSVILQLVDYGNKYRVHYQYLQPLLNELCHLPRMAQQCHLGYLYPPGSSKNTLLTEWQEEHIEDFMNILGDLNHAVYTITHVDYNKTRKSFEIELIDSNEDTDIKSVGETLLESGVAVEIVPDQSEVMMNASANQIRIAHGMGGISSNMSLDQKMEKYFEQNPTREAENVNDAVIEYDPRDEALTCRNLRPDGTCYKGKFCKLRHERLTNGFTRDREPVHTRAFNEDPLPCVGDEVSVYITHVVDVHRFYAQIKREREPRFGESLHNFIRSMNNPDVVKRYKKLRRPPALNQIVIAQHWNNHWYRAKVINILQIPDHTQEIMVEVFIVDFGDVLQLSMSELREITPEFLQLSFQAYDCRLYNVRHKDGMDPKEETRQFERRYLCQLFKAKIVAVPGYLEVTLENNRGEDLGLKLVNEGFGEINTRQNRWIPADETLLIE